MIDSQLREALLDFQRTSSVAATITNKDGSKSGKLAEALSGDKKIVVCTTQTFPFAIEAVHELVATKGPLCNPFMMNGAPKRIRTSNLLIRSQEK